MCAWWSHCRFSSIYPDYRERVLRHEAAHLLVGTIPQLFLPDMKTHLSIELMKLMMSPLSQQKQDCHMLHCPLQAGYLFGVPVTAYSLDLGEKCC